MKARTLFVWQPENRVVIWAVIHPKATRSGPRSHWPIRVGALAKHPNSTSRTYRVGALAVCATHITGRGICAGPAPGHKWSWKLERTPYCPTERDMLKGTFRRRDRIRMHLTRR